MAISIHTNLMAGNAARTLGSHYNRLSKSVQRLSSGLRINSAADDAAGLAIRELMRADVSTLNQGIRNANDAISMIQTADGALAVIDEKLIRMKELAEQAATVTYNSTQRLMIDSEFQAMGAEIDRIARATDFNGIHLLDGSLAGDHDGSGLNAAGAMKIHFGTGNASAEDYYYVEMGDCTTTGLGLRERLPFPKATGAASWINEAKIDYVGRHVILDITDGIAGEGRAAFMEGIDFYQLPVGLKNIEVTSNASRPAPFHKPHVCLFSRDGLQHTGPPLGTTWFPQVKTDGTTKEISTRAWWNGISEDELMKKGINDGVFDANASYLGVSNYKPGEGTTVFCPGANIRLTYVTNQTEIGSTWGNRKPPETSPDEVLQIDKISSDLVFFIGGHDNPSGGCNRYKLRIEADVDEKFLNWLKGMEGDEVVLGDMLSIETQEKAQKALETVDDAIVKKDQVRAHLGALQNRLENTVTNLSIQAENLQASESRISDTDVATEMTALVRNQILTQSATAMLSQANSLPRMLAGLLGG